MPIGNTDRECITNLGRSLKHLRQAGEQFCVFAFDCRQNDKLVPAPAGIARGDLPFSFGYGAAHRDANWTAAFYNVVQPAHTEKVILDHMGEWLSAYDDDYERPDALYIYSFLIPCMRDGHHGKCADNLLAWIPWLAEKGVRKFRIGWSNDDREVDVAQAIKHAFADLEDDDIDIEIYPGISIA